MEDKEMKDVIGDIYEEIKRRCLLPTNVYGFGDFTHHIELVYKIAIENYKEYGADYNTVALAALLHDVASVTNKEYYKEHHIIGAEIAEELLKPYNLDEQKIELIKKCIINHRGSKLKEKNTPEEILIADADAMAHFYSVPSLLELAYVENEMSIDEGTDFVYDKLQRSYNKLSEKGKKIIEPQYEAAKILLVKK